MTKKKRKSVARQHGVKEREQEASAQTREQPVPVSRQIAAETVTSLQSARKSAVSRLLDKTRRRSESGGPRHLGPRTDMDTCTWTWVCLFLDAIMWLESKQHTSRSRTRDGVTMEIRRLSSRSGTVMSKWTPEYILFSHSGILEIPLQVPEPCW